MSQSLQGFFCFNDAKLQQSLDGVGIKESPGSSPLKINFNEKLLY